MNYLKVSRKAAVAPVAEPTVGPPVGRDVNIVGHIWPADRLSCRDVRFHFHAKNPRLEVEVVCDVLKRYVTTVEVNPVSFHTKVIVEAPLIPLIQKKLSDLGLAIKWITVTA
jgi:hypothetical protein